MPRMLDLIRASAVPSHQMMSASKGALRLPAAEMVEILVYIAEHNKIFGEPARLTLAGWDEASSREIVADPKAAPEVLNYWLSPKNTRPALLPVLIENPAVSISKLSVLATSLKKEMLDVLIESPRVQQSPQLLQDLSTNHDLSGAQAARVKALISGEPLGIQATDIGTSPDQHPSEPQEAGPQSEMTPQATAESQSSAPLPEAQSVTATGVPDEMDNILADDPETDVAIKAFLAEHAKEIASEPENTFHPIGGVYENILGIDEPAPAALATAAGAAVSTTASPALKPQTAQKPAKPSEDKRDSVLQKIAKLDIKGRIQLAMKGTKEERSLLVRDGTKIVALAVLDSPKISDGEVEKFATQKNVLEAVLRAIPMKRRFAKNYAVVRGLVFNPRTPLDVSLGLMKNLLVADLRNLSGNKEVSETVRKLGLRMFKQKQDAANKS